MKSSLRYLTFTLLAALLVLLSACGSNSDKDKETAAGQTSSTDTANAADAADTKADPAADTATSTPAKEKVVTVGIVNSPPTLNQINDQGDSATRTVLALINDSLLDINTSFEFLPKLADSIETTDNQNYVVKLNSNAKWNDGQPFTTADVKFTLLTALNPKVESSFRLSFIDGTNDAGKLEEGQTELSGLTIVDEHTFQVKTKTPIDPNIFKETFATKVYFIPEHVLKDVAPDQLATNPYFQKPEVTIGAFKFADFKKDQYTEVVRNDNYYRPVAKLDKIYVKVLPATNLIAQLQTGDIQMNSLPVGLIPITDYDKLKALPNVTVDSSGPSEPAELFFNNKTINDVKVRQAIAYALNRQLIVDQLLKGQAEVIDGSVPSDNPYYNKDIQLFSYDPDKAKALLKEAGWDSSKTLRFLVPAGNKIREQASDILVQNLKDVGFKVDVQKFDFSTLIQKVLKGEYDLTIFNRDYYIEPSNYFSLFKSDNANNFIYYNNPQADELITQGSTESDPAKRHDIYNKLQQILHDDLPTLSVYSEKRLEAVSNVVVGGKPLNLGTFNNVNEWDLTTN
ncbi:peptide/nickel transport system substrate-binding protein [Paenibacillus cellulosilyticus]|uniref:Peptide/nickel transport system substrate-binding protein n=1 Tax=Paenibacillus cellulosilyticus TaxID=375489 RepID=A0A2V2YYL2_9BACL|nr:ABC transporter substrate-binding protein [Paenibacillus cellulosilyticus]PWW04822.1 peptide/nickel transport system substrate-binding protein [Paenibacillus cellulosilyticus]QKS45940.1 ABC transporter substrate-binding protein [Paenibacillus cellulosilyticus]